MASLFFLQRNWYFTWVSASLTAHYFDMHVACAIKISASTSYLDLDIHMLT